ncbi:MAG: class I SAM-dependent methyltransferase [Phycisphaerales bacterium]|nr:class I SAM-dependent methyltransferase [Phycisphaerales bacterium]
MSKVDASWGIEHATGVLEQILSKYDGEPIAIYGAGRHTQELLADLQTQLGAIAFVLDDYPSCDEIHGTKVVHPHSVSPESVKAVIVSSNSIESVLTQRAHAWITDAVNPPEIIEIYKDDIRPRLNILRPGPLPLSYDGSLILNPELSEFKIPEDGPLLKYDINELPPTHLRAGYSSNDQTYINSGKTANQVIRNLLNKQDVNPETFDSIFEWGCSTGRVLRHWSDIADKVRIWGCDIDAASIDWCARRLCPPLNVFTSTTQPSLPLPDSSFDLVYAISIFTHTPELWDMWMMELRRIIKPGGWLCVTIHDEQTWEYCRETPESFISKACPGLDFANPLESAMLSYGRGPWSQVFWRSESWRHRSSMYFDLVDYQPMLIGKQAVALHRRPMNLI